MVGLALVMVSLTLLSAKQSGAEVTPSEPASEHSSEQSHAEFLKNTIFQIQKERLGETDPGPAMVDRNSPSADKEEGVVEEMVLSKEQLIQLYQAALAHGAKLNLHDLNLPSTTMNYEHNLHNHELNLHHHPDNGMVAATEQGQIPGYYYYFYPIKDFLTDNSIDPEPSESHKTKDSMMAASGPKTVEPLFAAMAGFVGLAMAMVTAILFLPKFGALKSRGIIFKQGSEELITFTRLVAESVEGKDCSQRIACEVGRALRNMRLGTNSIRMMELMLPQNLSKQLARIRRSAAKKEKCTFIKCRPSKTDNSTESPSN